MNARLGAAFREELGLAEQLTREGRHAEAFAHLERAHILGQSYAWPHTRVHIRMLVHAFRTRDAGEIIGQLGRIPVGFVASLLGTVPVGNPGGTSVPATKSFPIPDDLARLLAPEE